MTDEIVIDNQMPPGRPDIETILNQENAGEGNNRKRKKSSAYPGRGRAIFLWIILIIFIAFWTFVLGVFLGRGTQYQEQAIKELEKRLDMYTGKFMSKETKSEPVQDTLPDFTTEAKVEKIEGKFTVQVAAFKTAQQADRLVKELKEKGFDAHYYHLTNHKGHSYYPVQAGGYQTKDEAREGLKKLEPLGFKGMYVEELR